MEMLRVLVGQTNCDELHRLGQKAVTQLGLRVVVLVPDNAVTTLKETMPSAFDNVPGGAVSSVHQKWHWVTSRPLYTQYWENADRVRLAQEHSLDIPGLALLGEHKKGNESMAGGALSWLMYPADKWSEFAAYVEGMPEALEEAVDDAREDWGASRLGAAVGALKKAGAVVGVVACTGTALMAFGAAAPAAAAALSLGHGAAVAAASAKVTWMGSQLVSAGPVGHAVSFLWALPAAPLAETTLKAMLLLSDANMVREFWKLVGAKCDRKENWLDILEKDSETSWSTWIFGEESWVEWALGEESWVEWALGEDIKKQDLMTWIFGEEPARA